VKLIQLGDLNMTKLSIIFLIVLTLIVVSVILYIGYWWGSNHHSIGTVMTITYTNDTNTISKHTIGNNITCLVEKFLYEARSVYLGKACPRDVFVCNKPNVDNFTLAVIFNATIKGDVMKINGVRYKFIVVRYYDKEKNVSIFPKKIAHGDICIEYIPRNKSVTYTGGLPYTYIVHVGNKTYKFTFWYIGFFISSFSILGTSYSYSNVCAIEIYLGRNHYLWLILVGEH